MQRRSIALLALWPIVGCQCGEETLGTVGPVLALDAAPVGFGQVPIGATKRMSVEVRNEGNGNLQITAVDAATPFGAAGPQAEVPPGQSAVVEVWFRPTNDEMQTGELVLMSNDPAAAMVSVPLSGEGVPGSLSVLPTEVDFENTKIGTTRSVELVLDNRGLEAAEGTIVPVGFDQPEHFSMTLLSSFADSAAFAVAGRTMQVLDLVYQPLDMGQHDGRVVFEICGPRCGLEVEVRASAAASVVRLEPPLLDFGEVGIGETATLQARLTNGGDEPIEVLSVALSGSPDLSSVVGRALPATVQPDDALGINVELLPTSAAEVSGELVVETGPVREQVRAAITGQGVGPLFEVEPEVLSFGVERQPGEYRRVLLLLNAGSSDVRVTGVTVSGDPAFALDALPGLPVRLGSGESLLVPVLFRPTTIAEYRGTVTVSSDDATMPSVDVPITGALSDRYCELMVAPDRVSFGLLPPGFARSRGATVQNVGSDTCNLVDGGFRAPTDPAMRETTNPWPVSLAAGDQLPLSFEYAPVIEAESKVTFVMHTDDPVFPDRTIGVFGTSVGNLDVFAEPNAVDFGTMRLNCAQIQRSVSLINAGTVDVEISNVTVTSSTSELTLNTPVATPKALPAGATMRVDVGYRAADLGIDQGDLLFSVADYGFDITVPLRGGGSQNPRAADQFEQRRNDKVDVLFVIDDSCSMSDDQTALAQNFQSFIQQADVRQVDFQIGITTTTVFPSPGFLVGPVMDRRTPNLDAQFRAQAAVGVTGSGFEQGLEAMLGVLAAASQGRRPQADLFRPDAARAIIIVSDEDDQSPLSVASYYNRLRSDSPIGFVTAMVSGQQVGCQSARGTAFPAPRYVEFARLTGGVDASICSNWAQTLSSIGQAAFGLNSRFFLSRAADQTQPIEVFVDGVRQTSGWSYDAADDSILFTQPPPEGATIDVEYTPVC